MTPRKISMVCSQKQTIGIVPGLKILTATGCVPCPQEKQRRSDMLINQPTVKPTRKVTAAGISVPISTLIIWGCDMAGISMPAYVATAIGGLASALFAYFARERK